MHAHRAKVTRATRLFGPFVPFHASGRLSVSVSFSKHLSVASHFEEGETNKAPCEISRTMPRQCQGKFLS
jgi:hypothetical protein